MAQVHRFPAIGEIPDVNLQWVARLVSVHQTEAVETCIFFLEARRKTCHNRVFPVQREADRTPSHRIVGHRPLVPSPVWLDGQKLLATFKASYKSPVCPIGGRDQVDIEPSAGLLTVQ